jgi:hypothetical protein
VPKKPTKRSSGATASQRKIAERALTLKQKSHSADSKKPKSRTTGKGMRPLPNEEIAPSGALEQEGHRPVLERSRKVR